jgi:Leucine-rich repeat (LRR) protein
VKTKVLILLLFLIAIIHSSVNAQPVLDSLTLSQQPIFKGISSALSNPDSVFRLDLSKKKLKALPQDLLKFKNLQELKISRNGLKELPTWIGDFKNLQVLDASYNDLKELPVEIGKLENLTFLFLNRNVIETLPHEIGTLKNLEVLELWDNEIGVLPEELKNCKSLRKLELRGILFSASEQRQINDLLPETEVYFSPSCNCGH